ncbi:uncharacterized protein LOC109534252 [Dendroctonus ponderosae]|uniref:Reverse transcriptase domain-containing protein n=1 Tax=Dendroctonus ponderosae TaxID=77166 RepID=A0AAR5P2P8_DENPD|nr:uncharacterized protein LOC109534252 [Dendroctonus ponderosae]
MAYNMQISTSKTKTLVIAKDPVRCKLALDNNLVEPVMKFIYLGVQITSSQNRDNEVRVQANNASRVASALRDVVWNYKHMGKQAKTKIYKTCVRPVLTYATETRAHTSRTKNIPRTTEMKILRNIAGYTLRDRKRNTDTRNECEIEDIVRWGRKRRRAWNDHVTRMNMDRVAKILAASAPVSTLALTLYAYAWLSKKFYA